MKQLLWLVIFLVGCDLNVPLPSRCQKVGVNVPDGAKITGKIDHEAVKGLNEVRILCQDRLTQEKYGCAVAVNEGEYVLYYIAHRPDIRDHERCHALYEVFGHKKVLLFEKPQG